MEIEITRSILSKNERLAAQNRDLFRERGVYVVNLMASPGAGKTSTILATVAALRDRYDVAVIEGDIASKVDAEKIRANGIPAVQVNTGGACHLEADMIRRAAEQLELEEIDLLIVENVGNLVCPTEFDLGESAKIMILSVPEGHDKPHKYPGIFSAAEAIILNKYDTMGVFDFDEVEFESLVRKLNGAAPIFKVSAMTGEGIEGWADWLVQRVEGARSAAR